MGTVSEGALVSQEVKAELRRWAAEIDQDNRFPAESFVALEKAGLMKFFVPESLGGIGGSARTYVEVASALGEECLSTALIWAMHCQQVAVLTCSERPPSKVLADIARDGALVASVTTEHGKGGALLRSKAPLAEESGQLRVRRIAPMVSYGAEARYFLITMQRRRASGVSLVLVQAGDGPIEVVDSWHSMGMRGTQSVGMTFDVAVGPDRLIAESFRPLAIQCMIPLGHLGWAAAWFGSARGLYFRVLRHLRKQGSEGKRDLTSETLKRNLAEVRLSLDLVEALIMRTAYRLEELEAANAPLAAFQSAGFQVLINNLKIGASRLSFDAADKLMQISGLFDAYLEGRELGAERVFRDLRSASLMLNNENLLAANGNFAFVEAHDD